MGTRVSASPRFDGREFSVEEQNRIPPHMEILRALQIEPNNLRVSAEKPARKIRRKGDPMAATREKRAIARVPDKRSPDLTFQPRPFFKNDVLRDSRSNVKQLDVFQAIIEADRQNGLIGLRIS